MRTLLALVFLLFGSVLWGQFTISPSPNNISTQCGSTFVTFKFKLTAKGEKIEPGTISIDWLVLNNALGTIPSSQISLDNSQKEITFVISFYQANAGATLHIEYELEDDNNPNTSESREVLLPMSTVCTPQLADIALVGPGRACGDMSNVLVDITSCNQINTPYFVNLTNLVYIGHTPIAGGIRAEFIPTSCGGNSSRQSFGFYYDNNNCGTSGTRTYTVGYTVQPTNSEIESHLNNNQTISPSKLCLENGSITDYFGIQVTNAGSSCMTDTWEITDMQGNPTPDATISGYLFAYEYSVRAVTFTAQGTYRLRATITGCSDVHTDDIIIEVCDGVPTLPPDPPAPIANICDTEEHCYSFISSECVDEYDFQYFDNKLILTQSNNGQTICVSDLLGNGFPRTTTIEVTATNVCGTSSPQFWDININPSPFCENQGNDWLEADLEEALAEAPQFPTGISSTIEWQIVPNPVAVDRSFQLQIQSKQAGKMQVTLHDLMGRLVGLRSVAIEVGENTVDMDSQGLSPGIYLLKIKTSEREEVRKVMIK